MVNRTQPTGFIRILVSMDEKETLNILLERGIITEESLKQVKLMQLEKKVALVHDYSITHLPDGRWKTYLPCEKGRKEIRSRSKEDLLEKVLSFYKEDSDLENIRMDKLFYEWLEFKRTITESPNTIKRHEQHFKKYLADGELFEKFIGEISFIELQAFCNSIVKDNRLTSKEWVNVKTILRGMYEYAYEKGYVKSNIMDRVRIRVKFRQENRKSGAEETFDTAERDELIAYLNRKYLDTADSAYLAVLVNFYLGLRVGELVALKWSDLEENNLHVMREEFRNQETNEVSIADHTKTHTDRYIPVTQDAFAIFYRIYKRDNPEKDDFIFRRDGKRIRVRQIAYVLEKYAKNTDHRTKSSHKIRKTYASILNVSGVPIDEIRKLLGHSNLETTLRYLYNPLTSEETRRTVEDALSSTVLKVSSFD